MYRIKLHLSYLITVVKSLLFISSLLCATSWAGEVEEFVTTLKAHYQDTLSIKKYSLNYHFYNKQYRARNYWDYEIPNRVLSVRMVEVDTVNKHFYDNDILYGPGGEILDRAQFQNDTHSYYYERNGNYLGKRYFNEGLENFDRFMGYHRMNIDFLAIRPLLTEPNIKRAISLRKTDDSVILSHKNSADQLVDYEFLQGSLQLVKIHNVTRKAVYIYSDYQTTRGITFARSVNKYYNGESVPAYISFNDKFALIDQVDASKLKLPAGYGPEILPSDGVLVAKELTNNLYLVTDSGAWRNGMFKVHGDNITVFGAAGNSTFAEKTIKLIKTQFPNKTISGIYVTHPQARDIAGLNVYADKGIKVIADQYTIEGIKAFPGFANDINAFKFQPIENKQVINGVKYYVLESLHAKRQSFAFFENENIIFQADFMRIAFDNTIPKVIPSYTKAFINFIRQENLPVNRIVGNYQNNNISIDVVNKVYQAML